MDSNTLYAMVCICLMVVLFGAYALYLGHDMVVISSVIGFCCTVVGYIYGRKDQKEEEKAKATLQV